MQKGAGLSSKIEKTKDNAVRAFSPPDNWDIDAFFLPGGLAMSTTPPFKVSLSWRVNSANPPPKRIGKTSFNLVFTASKLSLNLNLVSTSIFLIAFVNLSKASVSSSYCSSSFSPRFDSSAISSGAARLMAPSLIIFACISVRWSWISLITKSS